MNCFSSGGYGLAVNALKDVGFNPEITVRRFYKIGIHFSENAIFKKMQ